jgi:hypothetical protein
MTPDKDVKGGEYEERLRTLKAWCHWKRREVDVSADDLEMVQAIEDTISQVNNWRAKYENRGAKLAKIRALVDEQAEDPGLWSVPVGRQQYISEAHLQQELRKLHALIEEEP